MKRSEIIRFLILRSIGNFLILFALFGVIATFGPTLYYEVQFRLLEAKGVHYQVAEIKDIKKIENNPLIDTSAEAQFASLLSSAKEHILIPKDTFFDILIPKIGANSRIIPNVDPVDETTYLAALQKGVAHAKGSVFPGLKGIVYLFAHSTDSFFNVGRYNAVFYLLKDLTIGDDVVIFYQDVRYNYVVTDTKIVDPSDVSYLTKSQSVSEEQLVLQTCWPPGTTIKRLLVIAKPKR